MKNPLSRERLCPRCSVVESEERGLKTWWKEGGDLTEAEVLKIGKGV